MIAERFGVAGPLPNLAARFNAAPLQELPVVRLNPDTGERNLHQLRWGLVPVWAKDAAIGSKLIHDDRRQPLRHGRAVGSLEKP
ncbi:putative SOS response-associated peptidase YedK [Azospirillum canadense]|uniref:SOS response-associated peptidase family protein n=1 Tax=Azospirillum canadense TaxID=403962 RepID=UPI00387343BE|nr:putative SOS response-associated peptidase YedK [Azospirillum canadense]